MFSHWHIFCPKFDDVLIVSRIYGHSPHMGFNSGMLPFQRTHCLRQETKTNTDIHTHKKKKNIPA